MKLNESIVLYGPERQQQYYFTKFCTYDWTRWIVHLLAPRRCTVPFASCSNCSSFTVHPVSFLSALPILSFVYVLVSLIAFVSVVVVVIYTLYSCICRRRFSGSFYISTFVQLFVVVAVFFNEIRGE